MRRDPTCRELTELVTDYLEGALEPAVERRVDRHLRACDGCRRVLEQWRAVVRLSGALRDEDVADLDTATRDRLLATFRAARAPFS